MIIDTEWTFKRSCALECAPMTSDEIRGVIAAALTIASYTRSETLVPDAMGGLRVWIVDGKVMDMGWPGHSGERKNPVSPIEKYYDDITVRSLPIPELTYLPTIQDLLNEVLNVYTVICALCNMK